VRVLRIPPAIVFTVIAACDGGKSPPKDAIADGSGGCSVFCIPDPTSDAGTCPQNPPCAQPPDFTCPPGCRPVG
jgi:hypothetical protein